MLTAFWRSLTPALCSLLHCSKKDFSTAILVRDQGVGVLLALLRVPGCAEQCSICTTSPMGQPCSFDGMRDRWAVALAPRPPLSLPPVPAH